MKDTNLNIYLSDVRSMISGNAEVVLTKAALKDNVISIKEAIDCYTQNDIEQWLKAALKDGIISIEDAIDCYTRKDIEQWLVQNEEYYGYIKIEE